MTLILLGIILFFCLLYPASRYVILHPISCIYWGIKDIYSYFKYKKYDVCKEFGKIKMYSAQDAQAFGCGKSLTMAHYCGYLDKRYHGKLVWDSKEEKWVRQNLYFVSNLELKNVHNYIPFIGKDQFTEPQKITQSEHDVIFYVLDEAGIVFNSRQYKDNIPTQFLTSLLQIRHNKVGFILNAQRFSMVDKIMRETCNVVTTCKKIWRIVILSEYDAFSLENALNPTLIQPLHVSVWLAKNSDFEAYDTNFNISGLKEKLENGDILSTDEILATRGADSDLERVSKIRRRYKSRVQR